MTTKLAWDANNADAMRDIIRQSELSGAKRRAALLHVDRLPKTLSRPHHLRLARQAISSLASADRALVFELSRGRVGIVWRGRDGEVARAHDELGSLLAGQPDGEAPSPSQLLTVYELPEHAAWLLDDIAGTPPSSRALPGRAPLDLALLDRLEAGFDKADLSRFARWRPIMHLAGPAVVAGRAGPAGPGASPAWQERYFAVHELAANLCPDRNLRGDRWLFWRLTRTLDMRLLAMLTAPHELRGVTPLAINLNVDSVLSPAFVQFDAALPLALRGRMVINLQAADILSDTANFIFMRSFARARGYRLALTGATPGLLRVFDAAAAGMDFVHVAYAASRRDHTGPAADLVHGGVAVVLTGLDRPSDVRWAVENGFSLGRGTVFNL